MDTKQKMTMTVILTEVDIRKVTLNTRPARVDALTSQLKESLGRHYNFRLQYKYPEFNHRLCNLTDIEDRPEKPTLKVIPVLDLLPV